MRHDCTPACTAGWPATKRCHCSGCGENFSTPVNFDKHKPGACLAPDTVGLVLNDGNIWTQPGEESFGDRIARARKAPAEAGAGTA